MIKNDRDDRQRGRPGDRIARPLAADDGQRGRLIPKSNEAFDLTHDLHERFPTYIGHQQFSRREQLGFAHSGVNIDTLTMSEHVGTHIDAPLHFSEDGRSVHEIPIGELIAPLCIVDIREKATVDDDARLTLSDVRAWIAEHGEIPPRSCVAMLSGWGDLVDSPKFRNAGPDGTLHFPGIHPEVAHFLLEETGAVGLAVDTLSLDAGASTDFPTHRIWLPAGAWGLECVANLDRLPASGATMIVGAPKHRRGTGGPARVLAFA
jgi:kynurenine formamidase